jgi:hypothetical protein
MMDYQEARKVIKSNFPPESYTMLREALDLALDILKEKENPGKISDGSHTFDELYYHRMMLFAVICNTHKEKAWKSRLHDDGTMYDNYFIVGITTEKGDYSYHYHNDYWDMFEVKQLEKAHKWDGHTPDDITRLLTLVGGE